MKTAPHFIFLMRITRDSVSFAAPAREGPRARRQTRGGTRSALEGKSPQGKAPLEKKVSKATDLERSRYLRDHLKRRSPEEKKCSPGDVAGGRVSTARVEKSGPRLNSQHRQQDSIPSRPTPSRPIQGEEKEEVHSTAEGAPHY